mmetsp:Transcript_11404/g.17201  ORF Transcript_11404/g.17201 Transcript_11404/m.17201 type:complete len:95 (+) Transcript_11404:104-388(+)
MEVIVDWWKDLATQYNPFIHYSFVNDLPIECVQEFLVDKGLVKDKHAANYLFSLDITEFQNAKRDGLLIKRFLKDHFFNIFCKRMFKMALLSTI